MDTRAESHCGQRLKGLVSAAGIEVVGLFKRYPKTTDIARLIRHPLRHEGIDALRGIDLRLRPGRIHGLIGPNGAGKTTLLKILGGVVLPGAGRILINGEDVSRRPEAIHDHVGLIVTDERSFFWRLSLRENLRFFAILQQLPPREREDRIDACLDMVSLDHVANQRFMTLSTGMRQRLAIARGLLVDPPILLMDEATRSLDPLSARNVRDLVRDLLVRDENRLIVYSSHNLAEVQELCDCVHVIQDGRIVHEQDLSGDGLDIPQSFKIRTREAATSGLVQALPGVEVLETDGKVLTVRADPAHLVDTVVDRLRAEGVGIVDLQRVHPALEDLFSSNPERRKNHQESQADDATNHPDHRRDASPADVAPASIPERPRRRSASLGARGIGLLRTAVAFLRKDFLDEASYRMSFLLGLGGVVLTLLFLMVISDFIGPMVNDQLEAYGGNYFAFVVLGFGLYSFLIAAVQRLSRRIRDAQMLGTLEALLSTRTSLAAVVVSLPLYAFLQTSVRVFGYLFIGSLAFPMPVGWGNWAGALAILALTIVAFICLGLFVAGLTVAFRRIGPVNTGISVLSLFLGGIYYPVSMLPEWLQDVAQLLPITPALSGLRTALLTPSDWSDIVPQMLQLLAFIAIMLPTGMAFFRWCLRRAMRDGALTQY